MTIRVRIYQATPSTVEVVDLPVDSLMPTPTVIMEVASSISVCRAILMLMVYLIMDAKKNSFHLNAQQISNV